jgi:hypothetical protein
MTRPIWMVLIGFVMVLVGGIVLPYLMLPGVAIIPLDRINETLAWFLVIFTYGMSVAGLFLGTIGAVYYVRIKKPPKTPTDSKRPSGPFTRI